MKLAISLLMAVPQIAVAAIHELDPRLIGTWKGSATANIYNNEDEWETVELTLNCQTFELLIDGTFKQNAQSRVYRTEMQCLDQDGSPDKGRAMNQVRWVEANENGFLLEFVGQPGESRSTYATWFADERPNKLMLLYSKAYPGLFGRRVGISAERLSK